MKKKLFVGLILVMASIALYGCKAKENTEDKTPTEAQSPYDKDGDGYVDGWY